MNLQTLSTAELYLETVKGTTPDVPLCCSSQKFGSSGHKGAASRTCTAAGEASRAGGRSPSCCRANGCMLRSQLSAEPVGSSRTEPSRFNRTKEQSNFVQKAVYMVKSLKRGQRAYEISKTLKIELFT